MKDSEMLFASAQQMSYSFHEDGNLFSLRIESATRNDSSVFRCQAANIYGSASKIIALAVKEAPEEPKELKLISKSSRTLSLSWKSPYNGNDEIREYIIELSNKLDDLDAKKNISANGNQTSVILRGLQPFQQYIITVSAKNMIGIGAASKELIVFTDEEAPAGEPTNVHLTPIDAHIIKVSILINQIS